jgi:hypothetical protein
MCFNDVSKQGKGVANFVHFFQTQHVFFNGSKRLHWHDPRISGDQELLKLCKIGQKTFFPQICI